MKQAIKKESITPIKEKNIKIKTLKFLKKIWNFIWNDNSIWSWIINIILAFLLIKFLIYPGLGFVLGTSHPVVAVVSGSMEHDQDFSEWWTTSICPANPSGSVKISQGAIYESMDISSDQFYEFPFRNGFNTGDIMFLSNPKNIELGDVIVFVSPKKPDPIIHRVINIKEENGKKLYTTKGDNNCISGTDEKIFSKEIIIGKAGIRAPYLGYIKIGFVNLLKFIGVI